MADAPLRAYPGCMREQIPPSWREALIPALARERTDELFAWLHREEQTGKTIFPPRENWLRALEMTPLDEVKVVILGQDPYHGAGQAHGLAFSVPAGVRVPPSLANIFKELRADLGREPNVTADLASWARQGVLLLNTCLTVEAGKAGSHAKRGWEDITDAIIAAVADSAEPTVFILWGNHARSTAAKVPALGTGSPHLVITSPHPSPLSAYAGFFGSRPFSRANAFLEAHGRGGIRW